LAIVAVFSLSGLWPGTAARGRAATPDAPHDVPTTPAIAPQATPAQLVSALERAWAAGDAGAIASLCDSAVARVALKPGAPPAAAPTLAALAFLVHDQLAVVVTHRFQIVRLDTDPKRRTANATARWRGIFGGAPRAREVEVRVTARAVGDNAWLLTEIRAND
jgi:hypothetical protein